MWGLCKDGFLNRIFIVSAPQGRAAQRLVILHGGGMRKNPNRFLRQD